ncbi:hypothetical protein [Marinobacter sp.]|uniref:hypothetical protein n=1 Tax=Marinobacter sp. TaxID=50741 RepID=UPI0025C5D90F|nr:hypothetical protein [Marinobacter sp.]
MADCENLDVLARAQKQVVDLDALYRGYLYSAFPSGHSFWPRMTFPYRAAIHFELMESAYRLVCDRSYNEAFATQSPVSTEGVLEDVVAQLRYENISSIWCPISSSDCHFKPKEVVSLSDQPELVIPKKHHRHFESIRPTDIADGEFLSRALGITLSELNQLVAQGVIECVSSNQILRDRVFSLHQVNQALDCLFSGALGNYVTFDDALSLTDAANIAEKFGFNFIDCVAWCYAGELLFDLSGSGRPLSWIRVNREDLVDLCHSKFEQEDSARFLDRLTAMQVLGVPENVLNHLGRKGVIPSEKWFGPGVMFSFETIREFLRKYQIARRESVILGVPTRELWDRWLNANPTILLEALPGGHTIGIIQSASVSEAA